MSYLPLAARARVLDETHANATVVNTTTETNLFGLTLPANVCAVGDRLRLIASGDILNNSGGNVLHTFKLKVGGSTLSSTTNTFATSPNRHKWWLDAEILVESASAQRVCGGFLVGGATNLTFQPISSTLTHVIDGVAAADLTAAVTVALSTTMDTASASADMVLRQASLELVRKLG